MAQFHRLVSLDSRVSQFSDVLEIASFAVMMGFHHYDHHGNNNIKANTKTEKTEGISYFEFLFVYRTKKNHSKDNM